MTRLPSSPPRRTASFQVLLLGLLILIDAQQDPNSGTKTSRIGHEQWRSINLFGDTLSSTSGNDDAILAVSGSLMHNASAGVNDGATSSNEITATSDQNQDNQDNQDQCVLYMAPSSIPNTGFGIYTVKSFLADETILDIDGPSIAVTSSGKLRGPDKKRLDNVWWGRRGGMSDHMMFESFAAFDYQICFGALPNYHPFLSNLDFTQADVVYDDKLANRMTDPSAGAFSYYLGKHWFAGEDVQAGEELFLNYGSKWLDDRGADYDKVARKNDYMQVGQLLELFPELELTVKKGSTEEEEKKTTAFLETMLNVILRTLSTLKNSERMMSIMPKTGEQLRRVVAATISLGSWNAKNLARSVATQVSVEPRSVDWIRENGLCLDNIVPGPSQIPLAGQGAFARRAIKEGEMIVPVPLLHILNREDLAAWQLKEPKGEDGMYDLAIDYKGPKKQQLLFNYCFGHAESSITLCPMTNAILINHCSSSSSCGHGKGPNAVYRWAGEWEPKTQRSIQESLEAIAMSKEERLLAFEIVALRDIAPGEEIFIDYGEGWEKAWSDHVTNWKPPATDSLFAEHLMESEFNSQHKITTFTDLRSNEAAGFNNLFTACWYDDLKKQSPTWDDNIDDWTLLSDADILKKYGQDGSKFVMQDQKDFGNFWPCAVIKLENEERSEYTVRIYDQLFRRNDDEKPAWARNEKPRILTHYPRESIRFMTAPYRSDQQLPNAFRHFIEIRDEIFPQQWKDLREKEEAKD